jgi:hypothetical protein
MLTLIATWIASLLHWIGYWFRTDQDVIMTAEWRRSHLYVAGKNGDEP